MASRLTAFICLRRRSKHHHIIVKMQASPSRALARLSHRTSSSAFKQSSKSVRRLATVVDSAQKVSFFAIQQTCLTDFRIQQNSIKLPLYLMEYVSLQKHCPALSLALEVTICQVPSGITHSDNSSIVYLDAGSRYESQDLRGVSHIIDRLAFKSTSSRTSDEMLESLESLGGNIQCASSRGA